MVEMENFDKDEDKGEASGDDEGEKQDSDDDADHQVIIEDDIGFGDIEGADHADYMKKFIKDYEISLDVPGMYIQDAVLNPKNHKQLIQLVNYVMPQIKIQDWKTKMCDKGANCEYAQ